MKFSKSTFNLFFIFVSVLWSPLQRYYLHIDGAGRTLLFLAIIAVVLNLLDIPKHKHIFKSPAFICWTLLVLFSICNSLVKGFVWEYGAFSFLQVNFFFPLVFLIISIIENDNNSLKFFKIVCAALVIYQLVGLLNFTKGDDDRFMAESLGNMLPLHAYCCVFVSSMLLRKKGIPKWLYIVLVTMSLCIVFLAATRKALGSILLVLIGVVVSNESRLSPKKVLMYVSVILIAVGGMSYVLNHTVMGERMLLKETDDKYQVQLSDNVVVNDFLMKLLGDRSGQYFGGIRGFKEHPISGIGITNYMYATMSPYRLHTEYITQLAENGIIGFILLVMYYLLLFAGLSHQKKGNSTTTIAKFGLISVLFINLTAWTYNMTYIMVIYAIIIVQAYKTLRINESCNLSEE